STEQFDAWVTKWNPPDEHIYDLYYPDPTKPLPNPRQLLEFGWDSNLNAINSQFKKFFTHLLEGQLFPPLILLLAGLGLFALPRRLFGLSTLLGLTIVVYLLFFSIFWHYEPRYFLVWLPWVFLLGCYGLSWLCDK